MASEKVDGPSSSSPQNVLKDSDWHFGWKSRSYCQFLTITFIFEKNTFYV